MPPPQSAGCLVIRPGADGPEVLLAHARGATFKRPLFGIPKGLIEPGETPEQTAVRETEEETGLRVVLGRSLGSVKQKSGKVVHAFLATLAPESLARIDAHGRCTHLDRIELDVCRFYPLAAAAPLMIEAQRAFLDRLTDADTDG